MIYNLNIIYKIDKIINDYLNEIITYNRVVDMLKCYLNHKNISFKRFNETIELIEGFEFTKEIESGT